MVNSMHRSSHFKLCGVQCDASRLKAMVQAQPSGEYGGHGCNFRCKVTVLCRTSRWASSDDDEHGGAPRDFEMASLINSAPARLSLVGPEDSEPTHAVFKFLEQGDGGDMSDDYYQYLHRSVSDGDEALDDSDDDKNWLRITSYVTILIPLDGNDSPPRQPECWLGGVTEEGYGGSVDDSSNAEMLGLMQALHYR